MNFTGLFDDDRAVSPVIGVILMVAITVVLAAVVGSFVLGLGNNLPQTAPNANFQLDFEEEGGDYNVTATHDGGDTVPDSDGLTLNASDSDGSVARVSQFTLPASAGDSAELGNVSANSTVRVIWTAENGDSSEVLAVDEAPA